MMEFDRILAQAEALLVEHPVRTKLTEAEIKQIADYFYANHLGADQELREEGIGSDPVFASVHRQLVERIGADPGGAPYGVRPDGAKALPTPSARLVAWILGTGRPLCASPEKLVRQGFHAEIRIAHSTTAAVGEPYMTA
jgi:hypothetical protein